MYLFSSCNTATQALFPLLGAGCMELTCSMGGLGWRGGKGLQEEEKAVWAVPACELSCYFAARSLPWLQSVTHECHCWQRRSVLAAAWSADVSRMGHLSCCCRHPHQLLNLTLTTCRIPPALKVIPQPSIFRELSKYTQAEGSC